MTRFSYKYHDDIKLVSFTASTSNRTKVQLESEIKVKENLKMNFSTVIGLIYVFVILALVCQSADAVPKQYDDQ